MCVHKGAAAGFLTAASCARSELAEDEASAVTRASGEAFAIDVRAATLALRQKHTEAIVRERFPPIGARDRAAVLVRAHQPSTALLCCTPLCLPAGQVCARASVLKAPCGLHHQGNCPLRAPPPARLTVKALVSSRLGCCRQVGLLLLEQQNVHNTSSGHLWLY